MLQIELGHVYRDRRTGDAVCESEFLPISASTASPTTSFTSHLVVITPFPACSTTPVTLPTFCGSALRIIHHYRYSTRALHRLRDFRWREG